MRLFSLLFVAHTIGLLLLFQASCITSAPIRGSQKSSASSSLSAQSRGLKEDRQEESETIEPTEEPTEEGTWEEETKGKDKKSDDEGELGDGNDEGAAAAEEQPATEGPEEEDEMPDGIPEESVETTVDGPTKSPEGNNNEDVVDQQLHYVRLAPFDLEVSVQGVFTEDSFMDVLMDYMKSRLSADFEGFSTVTYSVDLFSQTTELPDLNGRQSDSTTGDDGLSSNITLHIHRLTSVFDSKPAAQEDFDIARYMLMLLENTEMFQEHIDSQPTIDATVVSMDVEFTIPSQANNAQQSQNGEEDSDSDDGRNVWLIAGITVGCFVALLWMVFLHGLQSRPIADFSSEHE